jgi:hypothetical protein
LILSSSRSGVSSALTVQPLSVTIPQASRRHPAPPVKLSVIASSSVNADPSRSILDRSWHSRFPCPEWAVHLVPGSFRRPSCGSRGAGHLRCRDQTKFARISIKAGSYIAFDRYRLIEWCGRDVKSDQRSAIWRVMKLRFVPLT